MTLKLWFAVLLVSSVASGRRLLESDTAGSRTLPRFAQCGGSGGKCDQYSSCDNSPFDGYSCSDDDVCNAVDDSYWQCEEAATPALEIAAYAQCGGINCEPALGDAASQTSCEDAPWSGTVCSDDSTSCQRRDDQFWQCLPTDTAAEEAASEEEANSEEEASPEEEASSEDASDEEESSSEEDTTSEEEASPEEEDSPEEASDEEEASSEEASSEEAPLEEEASPEEASTEDEPSTEEEASPEDATESTPDADSDDSDASQGMASVLSSAKAMGAKALGGVKNMGTQAVNAVKSMAADDDEEEEDSPPLTASEPAQDDSTEAQSQDASINEIAAYAQCGGINCRPVLGDAADDITCENAAWSNAACADSSTSCQRVDDYMWQCLPADAAADSSPEAADIDSEEEEEASILGSAKAMGVKAFGGAKAMGVKAMNAAKTMTTGHDEEEVSPTPEATQADETSTDDSSAEQDDSASDQDSSLETLILPEEDTSSDESEDDSTESEEDSTADSGDLDILTFAFNMECLQSALYSCALDGDAGPVAAGGAVTGCTSANLPDGYVVEETREISQAKKQHVQFLQSKLQVQCPAIDLTAFTAVANAAVDVGSSQTYNALTPQFTVEGSPMNIFLAAFFLEDVGVAMYQGLLPSIQSQDLRAAVTGMMADNAYHAGIVRDVAAMNAASDTGYTMTNVATDATADAQLNVHDFLSGLAQLRDTLDNTNDDNSSQSTDMGLSSLNGKRSATGVNTDDNGFTFARTPGQVLAILFGNSNSGTDSGLFFPEGVLGSNSVYTAVS